MLLTNSWQIRYNPISMDGLKRSPLIPNVSKLYSISVCLNVLKSMSSMAVTKPVSVNVLASFDG